MCNLLTSGSECLPKNLLLLSLLSLVTLSLLPFPVMGRLTANTDGEVYQKVMSDISDLRGREVGVSDGAAAQPHPPAQAEVRLIQTR